MSNIQPYQDQSTQLEPMAPVNRDVMEQLQAYTQAWSAAAQIAEQLARTDFAGPFKGKPADMAVAILKGANLGIPPESIGKSIYVVHGTPALYGKTALSIALQHGYIVETLEDTPQAVTVRMTAPHGQQMDVRYTIERAEQEGLVKGNTAQYKARPSKMLYWKCIGELTDRMIPHLTGGMPVKEDLDQAPVKMTATRTDNRGMDQVRAALQAKQEHPAEEPLPEAAPTQDEDSTIDAINATTTESDLRALMDDLAKAGAPDAVYDAWREAANNHFTTLQEQ